ncbi:hypothetical protein [Rhizobium sp. BK377]|jgi:hypothetical protein|uniref:hypothetical protein n=1 Tax=Rhizobium sp. BK377 TaxID=2587058 RepID=UPI00160F74E0|nr:hypothetical protein [Rhizobium sp. BK377]MBB3461229.1 hypothetical protein [Rhizobium sp. BK377]
MSDVEVLLKRGHENLIGDSGQAEVGRDRSDGKGCARLIAPTRSHLKIIVIVE